MTSRGFLAAGRFPRIDLLVSWKGRSMDDALDIEVVQPEAGRAIVVFKGEHDLAQVEALGDRLSALVDANELVVADFSDAEFVDSSIISLLLETKRRAEARTSGFRVQMGTECVVHRVFEIAGVLSLLECAPSHEEALGPEMP